MMPRLRLAIFGRCRGARKWQIRQDRPQRASVLWTSLLALWVWSMPDATVALVWGSERRDDGVTFEARIHSADGTIAILCHGPSPSQAVTEGLVDPMRGRLVFRFARLPDGAAGSAAVTLDYGQRSHAFEALSPADGDGWEAELDARHPFVDGLIHDPPSDFRLRAGGAGASQFVDAGGMSGALLALRKDCEQNWEAANLAVRPTRAGLNPSIRAFMPAPFQQPAWVGEQFDNGVWFTAYTTSGDGRMAAFCGGIAPGFEAAFRPWPLVTQPYTLAILLAPEAIGVSEAAPGDLLGGLQMAVGQRTFTLDPLRFSPQLGGAWRHDMDVGEDFHSAVMTSLDPTLRLSDAGGTQIADITTNGLGGDLAGVLRFCDLRWQRQGHEAPPAAAASLSFLRSFMAQRPEAGTIGGRILTEADTIQSILAQCAGPAHIAPDAVLRLDLNGDHFPDTVLHWGGVTCRSGASAGVAGAGRCEDGACDVEVHVSGGLTGAVEAEFMAEAVTLETEQQNAILVAPGAIGCADLGLPRTCQETRRWVDGELVAD